MMVVAVLNKEAAERERKYRKESSEKNAARVLRHEQKIGPIVKARRQRESNLRIRVRALMFFGGKCEVCEFNDMRALQIDHKYGGGTEELRKYGADGVARKALRNPNDYQILCANHNWIKRWDRNENNRVIINPTEETSK